jgi:arylsulfatase A-like enzyme
LKDEGIDDNTLIILSSDNGGAHYIGLSEINRPFRGFKATFFEGGIHSPIFMRWPGTIQAGSQFPYPVGHIDILPTAAGAAGADLPNDRVIDGVDLMPFLQGKAQGRPHQTLFWRSGQYEVVRDGDWKLQYNGALKKLWLFNLAVDPTEQNNLAATESARVVAMQALLKAHNAESVKPLWPSLLQGPVSIDHPSGMPSKPGEEYIQWDN